MKVGVRTFESCPESYGDGRVCRRDAKGATLYDALPGLSRTRKRTRENGVETHWRPERRRRLRNRANARNRQLGVQFEAPT